MKVTKNITKDLVAEIIANRNIVAIYQGQCEAGPRALGNRSLLYDPRDPDGKNFVNKVKQREFYRPFAASALVEHIHDWFDMCGLKESPYMMYAVDVLEDKKKLIPSVVHVDGTCRMQSVSMEQNKHYYELINEFYKITNIPMVFNTSFNLAGETLVESEEDAFDTCKRSDINYLYLPEKEELWTKT